MSIIQEPEEAVFSDMPLNALEHVEIDLQLKAKEIGPMLVKLAGEPAPENRKLSDKELELMKIEVTIAYTGNAFEMGILDIGKLTSFTCPECHGAFVSFKEGTLIRYRCHTGHAYTANALLASVTKIVEENLWEAMRGVEEATLMLEQMAGQFKENGNDEAADLFLNKARETRKRAQVIHELTFGQEIMSSDIRHKKENFKQRHNKDK